MRVIYFTPTLVQDCKLNNKIKKVNDYLRFKKGVIYMNTINKIVALTDEKNYLRNLLEAAEDTGKDLESIIQDRIYTIYQEIDKLEGRV